MRDKSVREEYSKDEKLKDRVVDSIDELVKRSDPHKPFAAAVMIAENQSEHLVSAVGADGKLLYFPGDSNVAATLAKVASLRQGAQIELAWVPLWPPPCPDPDFCEPGIKARRQRLMSELLTTFKGRS